MKKIIVLIIAAIATIALILCIGRNNKVESMEFNSDTWKYEDMYERYLMLDSLYEKYELVGMTEEQVLDLLGEYDGTYNPNNSDSNYYWFYSIRNDDFEGEEDLLIHFEDGVVTECEREWLYNL